MKPWLEFAWFVLTRIILALVIMAAMTFVSVKIVKLIVSFIKWSWYVGAEYI